MNCMTRTERTAKQLSRLKKRLNEAYEKQSIVVDETMDEDLAKIMEEEECQVQESFPEGSFQKIFWDQQKQAMKQKDMRGIR